MGVGMRQPAARALSAALFVVLTALTAASCATSSRSRAGGPAPADPPAARTTTHTFVPYRSGGTLTVPVRGHRTGRCWSASIAVPGAHAYRCFAGNAILDPCFAPPHKATPRAVACVADPWSAAVLLRLTKPLPATPPSGPATRPWAFVLASGARCVASTGTVPSVGGVNLPYSCNDGTAAALIDRPGRVLHAYDAGLRAATLHKVAVRTVWRA